MFDLLQFSTNKAVITDDGKALTYGQLQEEVVELSKHLSMRGLICCLCENSIGSLIGYISGINNHFPLILFDGQRDTNYISSYVERYQPEYIWMPCIHQSDFNGEVIYEKYGYSLVRLTYNTYPTYSLNDKLCLCLTTSGSTGSPKLVRLTLTNLESNAEAIAQYLNIDENERPITTLPMYYSFGLSVINSHLIKGATLLLTRKNFFSKTFWNFFHQFSATSIAGVPFTYEMLERLGFFHMDLPSLKTMIQAGGKLNAMTVKRYVQFAEASNKTFIVMYGQTEASPRMSYLPFAYAQLKPSSIGVPIPGGEFILYNSSNQIILEPDIEGELIYKGPNVCMGYAECRKDLEKGDDNNGFLRTGDIAYKDNDGFYYITGRLKRFVKIWGNRYNLDSIEQLIKPITSDIACVGDDKKIYVFIDNSIYTDDIIHLMSSKLQLDKSCFSIMVINQIPKTLSGKVQYEALKDFL